MIVANAGNGADFRLEDIGRVQPATQAGLNYRQINIFVHEMEKGRGSHYLKKRRGPTVAQGFGGGMARTGKTCGAVTGAYMVLGLANKISARNPREGFENTYRLINEFNNKFQELHSTTTCKELIGCDLSTQEGLAEALNKSIFTTVCPDFVRDSVKILDTLLQIKETL